jgi:hypothetical protein
VAPHRSIPESDRGARAGAARRLERLGNGGIRERTSDRGLQLNCTEANLGLSALQRLNPTDQPVDTPGGWEDRIATADHATAAWINRDAYASPGLGAYGTLGRFDTRTRHPFRKNMDLVITKAVELAGTRRAEIRFEFLNFLNRPVFAGTGTNFGAADFGRITTTRGYARITQVSMRYTF